MVKNAKNTGLYVIWGFFLVPFILDMVSTLSAGEFTQYLETNVFYHVWGIPGIIATNILVLVCLDIVYWKGNIRNRFSAMSVTLWLAAVRLYVVYNNFKIKDAIDSGMITIEKAAAVSSEVKTAYFFMLGLSILLPYLVTNLCFWFFRLDHKIEVKDG